MSSCSGPNGEELAASRAAAERDGGRGAIDVDGRRCYVED